MTEYVNHEAEETSTAIEDTAERKLTDDGGGIDLIPDDGGAPYPTVAGPKGGKVGERCSGIGKSGHSNALGLEVLEGAGDVEETLAAAADDGDRGPTELGEISRDIEGFLSATMDPSKTASSEDLDLGQMCQQHGAGDGGATIRLLVSNALSERC